MVSQEFTTTDEWQEVGPWGYPVQLALSTNQPVLMQFAYKRFPYRASRVTWQIEQCVMPPADYRFGRCYGVRIKTSGDTAATVFAVTRYREDPIIEGFSTSYNG